MNTTAQERKFAIQYFNISNQKYLPKTYTDGKPFSDGVAAVKNDSLWGFIDKKGKQIIDFKYTQVSDFYAGFAAVKLDETWVVLNKKGEITSSAYQEIIPLKKSNKPYFLVQNKNLLMGIIDANNSVLLPLQFALVIPTVMSNLNDFVIYAFPENTSLKPESLQNQKKKFYAKDVITDVEIYNSDFKFLIQLSNQDQRFKRFQYKKHWLKNKQLTDDFPKSEDDIAKTVSQKPNQELMAALSSFVYQDSLGKKGINIGKDTVIIRSQFTEITPMVSFVANVPKHLTSFIQKKYRAETFEDDVLTNAFYIYYYLVENNGKFGIYALDGTKIIPPIYENVNANNKSGFTVVKNYNTNGFYQLNGQEIIAPTLGFTSFSELINNRFIIHQSAKDESGNYVSFQILATQNGTLLSASNTYYAIDNFPSQPGSLANEYFTVTAIKNQNFLFGIIDRNGKEILPANYKYISFYDDSKIAVLQHFEDDNTLSFFDFKKQKIVKTLRSNDYNDFLIGKENNGIIRITVKAN